VDGIGVALRGDDDTLGDDEQFDHHAERARHVAGRHDGADKRQSDYRQHGRDLDDRIGVRHSPQRRTGCGWGRVKNPVAEQYDLRLRAERRLVSVDGIGVALRGDDDPLRDDEQFDYHVERTRDIAGRHDGADGESNY
jgi:hypothetical protein